MPRPTSPWHDLVAFLLLASASVMMVVVLVATRRLYDGFAPIGKLLAWLVVLGGAACLLSLAQSLARLYVRPALEEGRRRRKANP